MSVVLSLLRAIDRADGEALVMHVGEKPYVVTATGHAELAAKPLTIPAMTGMLDQLLPSESRQALDELGAVEYHLPPQPGSAADSSYSVVAARGGDDIWIEVRRRKTEPEPTPVSAPPAIHPAAPALAVAVAEPDTYTLETSGPIVLDKPAPVAPVQVELEPMPRVSAPEAVVTPQPEPVAEAERVAMSVDPDVVMVAEPQPISVEKSHAVPAKAPQVAVIEAPAVEQPHAISFEEAGDITNEESHFLTFGDAQVVTDEERYGLEFEAPADVVSEHPVDASEEPVPTVIDGLAVAVQRAQAAPVQPQEIATEAPAAAREGQPLAVVPEIAEPSADVAPTDEPDDDDVVQAAAPHHLAPVVPMAARVSHVARHEMPPASPTSLPRGEGLPHLLQVAAAQGASVLYVAVQARPSLRVDGEIRVLEHETPLTEASLEAGLKTILPNGATIAAGELETCDVPGVGRVQCLSFRDHRGLGAMFKMLPARAISSEQMGLGAPIQALCTETEGLVLVAGGRGAGKSTLVAALVDQMNRTRRDHVITVEQQIQYVHDNRQSFVSQREAREDSEFAEAVRSALREGPDVLVVDHVASSEAATFALHAAASGHLVIASITAPTTAAAVSRFMEFFGEDRAQARITLSEHLRGVVTQTLLRKTGGGRAAAREVLVNVPSVAALIADGRFDELASVLNGGRRVGMVPLNDALLGLVQSGALDVREAYRKSPDQQELVGQLNRAGLDTTFAERLA